MAATHRTLFMKLRYTPGGSPASLLYLFLKLLVILKGNKLIVVLQYKVNFVWFLLVVPWADLGILV
ncbi:unnamed protein product [Ectocarpus fasciculatus]